MKKPTRFLQALLWSLGFHLILLALFSMTAFLLPKDTFSSHIDVQLEMPTSMALATYELGSNNSLLSRDKLLATHFLRMESFSDTALLSCTEENCDHMPPLIKSSTEQPLPWIIGQELSHTSSNVYPLKITLLHGLGNMHLIEDARSLFITASKDTMLHIPLFAESLPQVVFFLSVDTSTGKIIESKCEKVLTDKRLQQLAKMILEALRFAPNEDKGSLVVQGELRIQFCGTFDIIAPLLKKQIHKLPENGTREGLV